MSLGGLTVPGFNIIQGDDRDCDGIGTPSNKNEFRRKHRWLFKLIDGGKGVPANTLVFLQKATRPSFKFEEPVVHHNQEVAYFAGKQEWEPIKLVWYDSQQAPDVSSDIWTWLQGVNEIDKVCVHLPGSKGIGAAPGYKGTAVLSSVSGCGECDETWTMYGCWPQQIDWSELDYTSTEIQVVSVTMRYDRAIRTPGDQKGPTGL